MQRCLRVVLFAIALCPVARLAAQDAPATARQTIRVSGGVAAANNRTKVQPVYPQDAKEQHISGTVVMRARIDYAGNVADLEVVSGPEILRASALEAVKQWTYKPYLLNGQPVDIDTTITVNYSFGE